MARRRDLGDPQGGVVNRARSLARRLGRRPSAGPAPPKWRHGLWPARSVEGFVVSFPKSGRTWLRVMLAVAEAESRGAAKNEVVAEWLGNEAPSLAGTPVLFTHTLSVPVHEPQRSMSLFLAYVEDRRRLFFVRDPRDVVVSHYFQVSRRARRAALEFFGAPAPDHAIRAAVEYGRFENMQRLERDGSFAGRSARLRPRDPGDPESFKTRKGEVGGYRECLADEDVVYVEARIVALLPESLGYREPGVPPDRVAAPASG